MDQEGFEAFNIMFGAASKVLLRAQRTSSVATRYAAIPWYRAVIRPCSSSSPFPANGQHHEERKPIGQDATLSSMFHHSAAAPSPGTDAAEDQNAVSLVEHTGVPVEVEDAAVVVASNAQVAVAEGGDGAAQVAFGLESGRVKLVDELVPAKAVEGTEVGVAEGAKSVAKIEAEGVSKNGSGANVAAESVQSVFNLVDGEEVGGSDTSESDAEADENNEEEDLAAAKPSGKNVVIDPILLHPQAVSLLKKLGLYKFVRTRQPRVDKQLCDEFLASYLHRLSKGCGMVQGKMVSITPEAVHRVTGLPLGVEPMQRRKTQGKFVTELGTRVYKNGYDMKTVKMSANEEENQVLVAVAYLLTRKTGLFCLGEGRIAARILWGIHESWHANTEVQWAAYIAELVIRKAERSRTIDTNSSYGSWLTAVIKESLRNAGVSDGKLCKDEDELLNVKLEQMEQKKLMLEAKEKEIKKREQKIRRHIVRCHRFASSLMNSV